MNGQALYNLCVTILGGEKPSKSYFLQLFNISKMLIESGINPAAGIDAGSRPWKNLSTKDTGQTVNGSNTYRNPFKLPFNAILGYGTLTGAFVVGEIVTDPTTGATGVIQLNNGTNKMTLSTVSGVFNVGDTITGGTSGATAVITTVSNYGFQRYLGESSLSEGSIVLFDGNNNVQYLTEVPIEEILNYKDQFGRFAVDYGNNLFYITGVVPGTFTIYQFYIQTTPDVTLTDAWQKIPARFHPILAYDACARWRLGTDYDDVNARNADDNIKMANNIFNAMASWDTELAISAVNSMDYRNDQFGGFLGQNYPGPRGTRANN